jgi:type I restriction enzyme S subunit
MSTETTHSNNPKPRVPKLRFTEFEGEWKKKSFGSIVIKVKAKHDPQKSKKEYPCIEMESISKESSILLEVFNSKDQKSIKNKFSKGDVLFGKLRPNLRKYLVAPFEGVCSSEIWVLKGKELSNDFLFRLIQTNKFYSSTLITSGSKMPRADWDYISSLIFPFPTLPEQQKIATFLGAVDEKIQQLTRKKALLAQYKKGVMQQLFSGKLRFKDEDGNDFPEWEEKRLGEIADRNSNKNTRNEVHLVLTNSATQGVVNQADYFDRDIANQENLQGYYIVELDDFVYNPRISVHAPVGPIKRNKLQQGVMSPLYSVFRFKEKNLEFFEFYFETIYWHEYLKSVSNMGARHDRMNITNGDFFKMPIPFPCKAEREKITNYLSALSAKIEYVNQQLTHTQAFKKGLLQQMFV